MKKHSKTIPTIIAIFLLVMTTAIGVVFVQGKQTFRLSASEDSKPQNVRITNLSESSFSVSWTTKKSVTSFLKWGGGSTSLENIQQDDLGTTGYIHTCTLNGLTPTKTYYFKINAEGDDYLNNGSPWQASTGPSLQASQEARSVSGTLLKVTGTPAGKALIFLSVGGSSPMSTTTSDNGSFVFPISQLRTSDLASYFSLVSDTIIEITAQGGPDGTSSAQIKFASSGNVPPLILGQVHDFKNLPPGSASSSEDYALQANLQGPNEATDSGVSGFALDNIKIATPGAKTVILESIDNGETVNTTVPEFFGKGPLNTQITITIHSDDPITGTTKTLTNGTWKWTPPTGLSEGSHTVTLTWKDTNGKTQTTTKNFIVAAAKGPAFIATPSATQSATLPPPPVSGIELPTLMMILVAFAFLTFCGTAIYVAK